MNYLVNRNSVIRCYWQVTWGWKAVLLVFTLMLCGAHAKAAEIYEVIRLGAQTYEQVEIQNKTATHLFIKHSQGVAAIKLQEIPLMVQQKLGLVPPPDPKAAAETNAPLLGFIPPQMVQQTETIMNPYRERFEKEFLPIFEKEFLPIIQKYLWIIVLLSVLCHLFFSFCFMLIGQKAAQPGSFLVWLPLLQLIPLFKAAKMSGWCFLLCFIPIVNFIVMVVWCFKICQALNKPALLGLLLLLPVTSLFMILYLAFSGGDEEVGVVKLDFAQSTSE